MSTASQGWQELTTSSKRECPKLFHNFSTSSKGFTLQLTDLIGLWQCSLDKYDIAAEAGRQHSSIDPSESTKQLNVLLSKLQQGLNEGKNKLVKDDGRRHPAQSLALQTTLSLPKPLKPLQWTFHLQSTPASELSEAILRPVLHELSASHERLDSLQSVIKEKDHVISKLMDRVSASGVDMSLIFPTLTGVSGRRGNATVKDAMKHVSGMAAFDPAKWKESLEQDDDNSPWMNQGLTKLVGGCEKCFVHTREEHEGWIKKLPSIDSLDPQLASQRSRTSQSQNIGDAGKGNDSTASDDEFETAATPPKAGRKRSSPMAGSGRSHAEISDDELGEPAIKRAKKSKLGALRRPKASPGPSHDVKAKSASPASEDTDSVSSSDLDSTPKASAAKKLRPGGLRNTAKAETSEPSSALPRSSSPARLISSHASTPSRRLGRVGRGRHKTASVSPIPEDNEAATNTPKKSDKSSTQSTPHKLGRLGLDRKDQHRSQDPDNSSPPATRTRQQSSPPKPPPKAEAQVGDSDATASTSSDSPSPATASKPITKHPPTSPPPVKEETQDKHVPAPSLKPPEPQETEEEATSRRREELKRTIQSGEAKRKKRRF